MSEQKQEQEFLTLEYMRRFHCIGSACETHCCQGWQINIEYENHKRLKRAMSLTAKDSELFRKRVKRHRTKENAETQFAHFALSQEGDCSFFDPDGLCEIQRRFGEDLLSSTCYSYPRKLNRVQNRFELSGSISCPEVARLCLLTPESTELDAPDALKLDLSRLALFETCPQSKDPFLYFINDIRDVALEFLSLKEFPLASRLFFIGYFANRSSSYFFKNCPPVAEERLQTELNQFNLQELHQGYQALSSDFDLPIQLINALLSQKSNLRTCRELFARTWDLYGEGDQQEGWTINKQQLTQTYLQRREVIEGMFAPRIELYLENYCKNYWLSNLYSENRNLLEYLQGMLARIAIALFLFYSHPKLNRLIDAPQAAGPAFDQEKLLDAVAVEAFHLSARAVEHDPELWKSFSNVVNQQGLTTLAHLVQLLKFVQGEAN